MLRRVVTIVFVAASVLCFTPLLASSSSMGAAMGIGGIDQALFEISMLDDEELEARAADLQRQLAADPTDDLYQQLVACVVTLNTRHAEADIIAARDSGQEIDYAEVNSRHLERTTTTLSPILDQWQEHVPESCGPLLIRAQLAQDVEERNKILETASEQCPDDTEVAVTLAFMAVGEGNLVRGQSLLRDFIAEHPKEGAAYEALIYLLMFGDGQSESEKIVAEWLDNCPDDLRAMQMELSYRGQHMDKTEAAAAAAELLSRDHDATQLFQTCQVLSELELHEQAEPCLERVLQTAGEENEKIGLMAFGEMINIFSEQRNWDRIEELAVNIPPHLDSPSIRIGMATVLVQAERCATANELIHELDGQNPPKRVNASIWKTTIANIRSKCGDAEQATSDMLEVYRTGNLDDLEYLWITADLEGEQIEEILLQRINDGDDPAKVYEILASTASREDSPEKRLAYLEAWALEAPGNPEPVEELASTLRHEEGGLELAIEYQIEAVRRAGETEHAMYAAERLVSMLIEVERYEEATAVASRISSHPEGELRSRRMLAEVATAEGRTGDAIDLYQQILAEDPQACFMVTDLLELLRDKGRMDQIDAIIDQCSRGEDDIAWTETYSKAFAMAVYAELDLYDRALAMVENILDDEPENSELWINKANYLLKLGRWDEAEAAYVEAIRISPRDEAGYQGLAELYRMDERWQDIVALLEPFVAETSTIDHGLGLQLARAQAAAGSEAAASATLERTVEENPGDFDAWYELGQVSARLDRTNRAGEAYRQFLDLTTSYDPDDGGSCSCRCDVIEMRDEAKEFLAGAYTRVAPQQSASVS